MRVARGMARRAGLVAAAGLGLSALLSGTASQARALPAVSAGAITIKPIASQTGVVGNPFTLTASATDSVKGATLKYQIGGINGSFFSSEVAVSSISVNRSVFTGWLMLPGVFQAQVTAFDDKGNSATTRFRWTVRYDNSGPTGPIRLGSTGKCLDTSRAGVRLWACNGTSAQRWTFERDWTVRAYGKCLTEAGMAQGWPLVLKTCTASRDGQLWSPRGLSSGPAGPSEPSLVNMTSGRCADDVGGNKNGAAVEIKDCQLTAQKVWTVPAGPIQSEIAGMCLTDPVNRTAPATRLTFAHCDGSASQRWSYGSGATLRIHGKCLAMLNEGTAVGTPAVLRPCNGRPDERWGYFQYHPEFGVIGDLFSGGVLGAAANAVTSGTQVRLEPLSGRAGVDWRML